MPCEGVVAVHHSGRVGFAAEAIEALAEQGPVAQPVVGDSVEDEVGPAGAQWAKR